MKKTLVTIVGPTAIGKTRLAINLAKHYNTDILSADSRQIYKEMRIGTAVPSDYELQLVRHHFIHNKSIQEDYTVGDFEKESLSLLEQLFKKKDIVLMTGGSGLYINAVLYGLNDFPDVDKEIRRQLNSEYDRKGIEVLQKQLKELDPLYYQSVDLYNPHRLIRALEVSIATKRPFSSFLRNTPEERNFNSVVIGLKADRDIIYQRINNRVDQMLEEGLLKEVQGLIEFRNLNALRTVGYRELFDYFDGKYDLDFAIEEIKKNTRRFAKRQLTWFQRDKNCIWFDYQANLKEIIKMVDVKIEEPIV